MYMYFSNGLSGPGAADFWKERLKETVLQLLLPPFFIRVARNSIRWEVKLPICLIAPFLNLKIRWEPEVNARLNDGWPTSPISQSRSHVVLLYSPTSSRLKDVKTILLQRVKNVPLRHSPKYHLANQYRNIIFIIIIIIVKMF